MYIRFADGSELPYIEAIEGPEYYDNAQRRVLRLQIDPAVTTLDAINALASDPDNLASLTLVNDDQNPTLTSVYDNYGIKISLSLEPVTVSEDKETGAAIRAERMSLALGRYTPIELQLMRLGVTI